MRESRKMQTKYQQALFVMIFFLLTEGSEKQGYEL